MRRVSISGFVLVLLLAAAPTWASTQPTFTRKTVQLASKKWSGLRTRMVDPAQRKKLIGSSAVTVGGVAMGVAIDSALLSAHLPPLAHTLMTIGAPLLANGVPVLAEHVAQMKLHDVAPAWFEEEEHKNLWQLGEEVALSAAVGSIGELGIDKAASLFLPNAKIPVGLGAVRPLLHLSIVNVNAFGAWIAAQYATKKLVDFTGRAYDKLKEKISGESHTRETSRPAKPEK